MNTSRQENGETVSNRQVDYGLVFGVPKSLSTYLAITGDRIVENIARTAVDDKCVDRVPVGATQLRECRFGTGRLLRAESSTTLHRVVRNPPASAWGELGCDFTGYLHSRTRSITFGVVFGTKESFPPNEHGESSRFRGRSFWLQVTVEFVKLGGLDAFVIR